MAAVELRADKPNAKAKPANSTQWGWCRPGWAKMHSPGGPRASGGVGYTRLHHWCYTRPRGAPPLARGGLPASSPGYRCCAHRARDSVVTLLL
eukprot:2528527-Prymnesium_polylepis.2